MIDDLTSPEADMCRLSNFLRDDCIGISTVIAENMELEIPVLIFKMRKRKAVLYNLQDGNAFIGELEIDDNRT